MSRSPEELSSFPCVVGEFGDTCEDNHQACDREGTINVENTIPTTTGRENYRTIDTHTYCPIGSGNLRQVRKRVGEDVELMDARGKDVVELLSSQEPSPGTRNTSHRQDSRVVDLTCEESEFEMVSCTIKKAPVRRVRIKKNSSSGEGKGRPAGQLCLSTTLHMMMGSPKEGKDGDACGAKNPVCGICFEGMGKNTDKPMAAGNCGHVYCKMCLVRAVKTRKKCPGCSAKMTAKQIRNIFFDLS